MKSLFLQSEPWMKEGNCRGSALEAGNCDEFFPPQSGYGRFTRGQDPHGKLKCKTCPVKAECLDYALANHIQEGIWGGLTFGQRKSLRRRWVADADFDDELKQIVADAALVIR